MSYRYVYGYGYKSHQAAEIAVTEWIEEGTVSKSERPQIERYEISGVRRYKVTLQGA
tara:strand:- start:6512 stop:6682 length:171 start_codon:yes stop_codon:yes gene_type:complete